VSSVSAGTAGSPDTLAQPDAPAQEARAAKLEALAESTGALGVYLDGTSGQYVVVVPTSGRSSFSLSAAAPLGLAVRVETRDIDIVTINQIGQALESLKPTLVGFSYGFGFDPQTGTVTLASEAPEPAFASILRAFPGKISFRPGWFRQAADWSHDTPPYWGGAWLNGPALCTSGFSFDFNSGGRAMVTAGHCFASGAATNMGTAYREAAAYPYYDFELVTGQTYGGYIFDSGSTGRQVINASNPSVGASYCTTGRNTGIRCGWTVRKLNQTICFINTGNCNHSLAEFYNSNQDILQPGDSGGPFWFNSSSPFGAGIRGINTGWSWDLLQGYSNYATQYQTIANYYVGHATWGS
jgi:hypothetical protein